MFYHNNYINFSLVRTLGIQICSLLPFQPLLNSPPYKGRFAPLMRSEVNYILLWVDQINPYYVVMASVQSSIQIIKNAV